MATSSSSISPGSSTPPSTGLQAEAQSAATINKKGVGISSGKRATYLTIGSDPRFFLEAQIIKNTKSGHFAAFFKKKVKKYVEVEVAGQPILLKINTIADRFHLKNVEILQHAETGRLVSLLTSQAERLPVVLAHYQTMILSYQSLLPTQLKAYPLNSQTLIKVISAIIHHPIDLLGQDQQITTKRLKRFIFSYQRTTDRLELAYIAKELGRGSSGTIYDAVALHSSKDPLVFKELRTDKKEKQAIIMENFKYEYEVLNSLQTGEKPVWGIQRRHKKVVHISQTLDAQRPQERGVTSTTQGIFMYKYSEGNLLNILFDRAKRDGERIINKTDALIVSHQLLYALNYLAINRVLHRDIKSENIFIDRDHFTGRTIANLGDFGGSYRIKEDDDQELFTRQITHTPDYTPPEEYDRELALKRDYQQNGKNARNRKLFIELGQKRDVFSTGVVLYELWTNGLHPFAQYPNNYPDLARRQTLPTDMPASMISLIERMTTPNFEGRLAATEALEEFLTYLKKSEPAVLEEINHLMARLAAPVDFTPVTEIRSTTPETARRTIEDEEEFSKRLADDED